MPDLFETGTHNYIGLAALCAEIDYLQKRGIRTIHEQGQTQISSLTHELKKSDNILLQCGKPDVPILSFTIENLPADDR